MGRRVRGSVWRVGLTTSLLLVFSVAAYAQTAAAPSPDTIVQLAERNSLLAVIYVLAFLSGLCVLFGWNMFKANVALQDRMVLAMEKAAAAQAAQATTNARLADALNQRPCILVPPQPRNPNALGVQPT